MSIKEQSVTHCWCWLWFWFVNPGRTPLGLLLIEIGLNRQRPSQCSRDQQRLVFGFDPGFGPSGTRFLSGLCSCSVRISVSQVKGVSDVQTLRRRTVSARGLRRICRRVGFLPLLRSTKCCFSFSSKEKDALTSRARVSRPVLLIQRVSSLNGNKITAVFFFSLIIR